MENVLRLLVAETTVKYIRLLIARAYGPSNGLKDAMKFVLNAKKATT